MQVTTRVAPYRNDTHIDANFLGNMFNIKPELLPHFVKQMVGTSDLNFGLLAKITGGVLNANEAFKIVPDQLIGTTQYRYNTTSSKRQPIMISVGLAAAAGANRSKFVLGFPTNALKDNDVVRFSDDAQTLCIVFAAGTNALGQFMYEFQIHGDKPVGHFIPASALEAGCEVGFSHNNQSEESIKGGSNGIGGSFGTGYTSIFRTGFTVTGSVGDTVQEITFTNAKKQKVTGWVLSKHYSTIQEQYKIISRALWSSTCNVVGGTVHNIDSNTDRPIIAFDGIAAQIAQRNNMSMTGQFRVSALDEYAYDIHASSTDKATHKQNLIITGTGGIQAINKALENKMLTYINASDNFFLSKDGEKLSLDLPGFSSFKTAIGSKFSVAYYPDLDDKTLYPAQYSNGRTKESYNMYMLDTSVYNDKANVSIISKKDLHGRSRELVVWATEGGVTFGNEDTMGKESLMNVRKGASGLDGAAMHYLSEMGVVLLNTDACAKINFKM